MYQLQHFALNDMTRLLHLVTMDCKYLVWDGWSQCQLLHHILLGRKQEDQENLSGQSTLVSCLATQF